MEFNPSKCEAISFTKKTKPVKAEHKLHDQTLATVTSPRYLGGVHISNILSWNVHSDITAKKATQSLNFIRRKFSCCSYKKYNTNKLNLKPFMHPLVSKLVKASLHVAGLVGGTLPDLKLFLRQFVPTGSDPAHLELLLEFRHSDPERRHC